MISIDSSFKNNSELHTVSSRSHLYHLEPIGLHTPYCESFTSYITRLAYLYPVQPRALILQEILPLLKISDTLKPENRLAWLKGSTGLNGMTPLVAEWVQVVEHLTLYSGLQFLTMLTWCNVVDQSGLVRQTRAWCPNCYDEWFQAEKEIYDPLIWAIRAVDECPRHKCSLLYQCPHQDCQKSLPLLDAWSKPGFCPKCNRFLGSSTMLENEESDREKQEWQEWVSNAIGELIAFSPCIEAPPRREIISSNITAFMEQTMTGSVEALAHSLGVSGLKLRGWQRGLHVPQFDTFLRLCRYMDVSPLNFLTQKLGDTQLRSSRSILTDYRPVISDQELQQQLEVILHSGEHPFPSVKDVAKQFKYPVQVLEHKFPVLCSAISQKHQQQLNITYQRNFLEKMQANDELRHLSLNTAAKLIGCNVTQLKYRFPDLCFRITHSNRKKLDLESIQLALDEFITSTEIPPPRVKDILTRLKCSSTTLYHYFPDACHTITKNYQEWLTAQYPKRDAATPTKKKKEVSKLSINQNPGSGPRKEVSKAKLDNSSAETSKLTNSRQHRKSVNTDELQQALKSMLATSEEPFPTVVEVAERLRISSSALYQYFPELCYDITIRTRRRLNMEDIRRELEMIVVNCESSLPSLGEISRQVECPETSLRRYFPEFCKAIVQWRKSGMVGIDQIISTLKLSSDVRNPDSKEQQKKKKDIDSLRPMIENLLEDPDCPSMVEVAERLESSTSSLYHYFPRLCRAIADRHKANKSTMIEELKKALEDILSNDQGSFPTVQEVAITLRCSDKVLYHHFPKLCHAISKRHRPDLTYLQECLEDIFLSPELPPTMKQIAQKAGCSVAILRYYFPEQCETIKERLKNLRGVDEQRRILESVVNAKQISVSVNEVARNLGCSSSILYKRFPELCRVITERRWKLSDSEELRSSLDAALTEEPSPTLQEVAKHLGCPAKNLEYYFPDLCKAIAERHRLVADIAGQQRALEALLNNEEPVSFQEAARRLGVKSASLRKNFPELSFLISGRYKDYRKKNSEARVQNLCDEVRQAAFLLHSQGIRPDKTQIGYITGKPVKFRLPEVREALQTAMIDLGYEL